MPCYEWKCALIAIFGGVDISEVPWYDLLWEMDSQWGSQKLLQGLVSHELLAYLSVFNLYLAQWIMAILSKGCKPGDKVQTNMRDLCLNFVEGESYLESNATDTLAPFETHVDGSIDSGNFSVRDCLPLIWKDSILHMHGLAVYVKEGFCRFLLTFSTGFTSLSVLLLFPQLITLFIFMPGFLFSFI